MDEFRSGSDAEDSKDVTPAAESGTDDNLQTPGGSRTPTEIGGRKGPDPTRYGDWEKSGRCIDF